MADVIANVADGTATYVAAAVDTNCGRWNSHFLRWLMLLLMYMLLYNKGLSESFKNICKRYGIQVHFKNGKTIKDELEAAKDKDHVTKKSGII